MIWIKTEEENMTVTSFYLRTIGSAFEKLNEKVTYTSNMDEIRPQSGDTVVICTAPWIRYLKRKDIKVIYWAQGVWPEESYMRHSSGLRFFLTSRIEKAALKRSDFIFFVSEHMRTHYIKKYKLKFEDNYYIMPCSNDSFHTNSFETKDKYEKNTFCYAGATSVWQCFEETVSLYSCIEKKYPESKLLLLVKDKELAHNMLEKYHVKNYEIDFVPVDKLPERLKSVKYGFILRQPSVVNAVATPTKTLTYISNGVIPIYSQSLKGISEIFSDCKYKVELKDTEDLDTIEASIGQRIDKKDIIDEYSRIYDKFYDIEKHIERIAEIMK